MKRPEELGGAAVLAGAALLLRSFRHPFAHEEPGGNEMGSTATILHADLDAFYASVEQLLDPRLRGKPIAVGGGVVLAASYEARAFSVRSGMPGRRARQLCPELVFVGGHFDEYQRLGDAAIAVMSDFTPAIERISIDEAFADVAGCTHLFGSPAEIARIVRARVRAELGLPMSIGVARPGENRIAGR
jgi:DNA polymerase-4